MFVSLSLTEYDFSSAGTYFPVRIQASESQILKGFAAEIVFGLCD
jgi:hypothetical protein